jgi:peroxiredoxin
MIHMYAIHVYVLLLLAWFQAPPQGEALRSGCSAYDRQLAVVGAEDQVEVNQALAGYAQTCYQVTVTRIGQSATQKGYLLGEANPAIAEFVHHRQEIGAASLEAEARLLAAPPPAPKPAAVDKGQSAGPAPEPEVFQAFSGRDMNGKAVSLAGMRGRVTLVTFWSPKSATSQGQQMSLMPLYNKFSRSDLSVVGISTDPNPNHIREALDDVTLGWPQIGDTGGLAKRYNVDAKAGTTFILDASHRIVAAGLKGPALESKIRELLAAH